MTDRKGIGGHHSAAAESRFRNHYECDQCGNTWQDEWSCTCNDKCASCGAEIEPHESEEIAA